MPFSLIEKLEQQDGLLTAADIMRLTGFGKRKVYEMLKTGVIPVVNFGDGGEAKKVDPHTWAYKLKRLDPMLREAARRR
jgi:hypothetical protein